MGSRAHGLISHGVWDLPRPGIKPTSPALAGGFFTTDPPGKPNSQVLTENENGTEELTLGRKEQRLSLES